MCNSFSVGGNKKKGITRDLEISYEISRISCELVKFSGNIELFKEVKSKDDSKKSRRNSSSKRKRLLNLKINCNKSNCPNPLMKSEFSVPNQEEDLVSHTGDIIVTSLNK